MKQVLLSEIDFCVIDTETTGGSHDGDRVIDIAVFGLRGGEVTRRFQSLINPGRPIPAWISGLTGINDDMVKYAPTFEEISEELFGILDQGVFAAHNAGFDYGFIQHEFGRVGKDFIRPQCCTLKLARKLLPELPSRSLGMVCEHLLIDIADRHRAHGDAEATAYVLKDFFRQLKGHHRVETWADLENFLMRKKQGEKEKIQSKSLRSTN